MKRRRGVQRRVTTGAILTAGILAIGAVAWACTVQIGTLEVCAPRATLGDQCTRKENTNGTGSQAGSISVGKKGSPMSITGQRFVTGDRYTILFASPAAVLAGANCHDYTAAGVSSLVPAAPGSSGPGTVLGPSWALAAMSPNVPQTGTAKICVQDFPNRVNGTQVSLAVI